MQTEFLLVGQGLSGTWLSYFLEKEGRSFILIDEASPNTPSRQAGGLINPITGRNKVKTWLADELLHFTWEHYQEMGQLLGITGILRRDQIQFFAQEEARAQFRKRIPYAQEHLEFPTHPSNWTSYFNHARDYGIIKPVYVAQLEKLIPAWRKRMMLQGKMIEEVFDPAALNLTTKKASYKNIQFERIIYCDGKTSLTHPRFSKLPFALSKGEALVLRIPDLPPTQVFKHKLTLIPMAEPGTWWAGASYQWSFENGEPTQEFLEATMDTLNQWLRIPFELVEHRSAIRAGTKERKPLVGLDPLDPRAGLLNGMGSKGCSLAPYFAKQLVNHILFGEPIHSGADCALTGVL